LPAAEAAVRQRHAQGAVDETGEAVANENAERNRRGIRLGLGYDIGDRGDADNTHRHREMIGTILL
jgi:hypothetical protein